MKKSVLSALAAGLLFLPAAAFANNLAFYGLTSGATAADVRREFPTRATVEIDPTCRADQKTFLDRNTGAEQQCQGLAITEWIDKVPFLTTFNFNVDGTLNNVGLTGFFDQPCRSDGFRPVRTLFRSRYGKPSFEFRDHTWTHYLWTYDGKPPSRTLNDNYIDMALRSDARRCHAVIVYSLKHTDQF